jgi:predicted ATPase
MPPRKSGDAAPSPEIFISYAGKDRAAAETICATLEGEGVRCWIAPRDVTSGVPYASVIVEAIAAARIVLVVFSHAANRSDGVLNEVELAFNRKRPVLTVRIEECEPKGQAEFYLRRGHWFDAFADVTERLQALPKTVRAALSVAGKRRPAAGRSAVKTPSPTPQAGNLVVPSDRLFGRDADVTQVVELLAHSGTVTLWGSGGVGKTRLALAAAARVDAPKGGAWFVDLAPVSDGASVPAAVASVLGIREERHRPLLATVTEALAKRDALVVLDNCEHVIEGAAALVDQTLRSAAVSRFLCTSREPLAIHGETVFRVEPLALPDDAQASADSPAIQLFLERGASAGGRLTESADELAAIATIVRRLDGIPFAIELAAARCRSMPPTQIARALEVRLRLLEGGNRTAVARQQTVRGTIDWSYRLLSEAECFVFREVSVFAGGWTLDALANVVRGQGLTEWDALDAARTLTEKSLAALEAAGERYRLLETTREYARELLAPEEQAALSRRHAEYFHDLAARTRQAARVGTEAEYEVLRAERANLNAAIEWSLGPDGDAMLAAALCGELTMFWDYAATPLEGLRFLERVVKALATAQPTHEAASAWYGLAALRMTVMMKDAAYDAARQAASLAVAVADRDLEARSLMVIGHYGADVGDANDYRGAIDRALKIFRELGDLRWVASALASKAKVAWLSGDLEGGRRNCEEAAAIAREIDIPRILIGVQLMRAEIEFAAGDIRTALSLGREVLNHARETQNQTQIQHAALNLAAYLLESDTPSESLDLVRELLEACTDEESVFGWRAVQILGVLAADTGRRNEARRFLEASIAGFRALGYHPSGTEEHVRQRLAAAAGDGDAGFQPVPYSTIIREAAALAVTGLADLHGEAAEVLLES